MQHPIQRAALARDAHEPIHLPEYTMTLGVSLLGAGY